MAGDPHIAIDQRDVALPLTPPGEGQATALGRWFAARSEALVTRLDETFDGAITRGAAGVLPPKSARCDALGFLARELPGEIPPLMVPVEGRTV